MNRPWYQMYSRDWLDNKELRRCSPVARAVLVDLMCLAHEGEPYGHLCDRMGALTEDYMAARCFVAIDQLRSAIEELVAHHRLSRNDDGTISIPRMVADEDIRLKRASGGVKGGNPNLVVVGKVGGKVNLPSREKTASEGLPRSDSDSVYGSVVEVKNESHIDELAERMYGRHPKKKNRVLVTVALHGIVSQSTEPEKLMAEIEASHAAWCETMDWVKENGRYCPKLDEWIADKGYMVRPSRDSPAFQSRTEPRRLYFT